LSAIVESQAVHVSPPTPHALSEGVVHDCPEQQPSGQDVPSQMQLPPEQRSPAPQAIAPLQVHWPAAEHPSPL
jgi:hypothetical protein